MRNGNFSNHSKERVEHDYYSTDPVAAEWLIKIEDLDNNIWECACGEGNLSEVFVSHGFNVKSTDLIDRGYGEGGVDFLKEDCEYCGDIVTNPPYRFSEEFIRHALDLIKPGNKVCMFLKLQFLESSRRKVLFEQFPPKTVWVSSSRIICYRENKQFSSSMCAYAWFVWEKGYKKDTVVKWFN